MDLTSDQERIHLIRERTEMYRKRFVFPPSKQIQDATNKESALFSALITTKLLSDLVENLVLLYFVNDKFRDNSSQGLIFGLFILFDFLDRIFSFFGIIKYVIRLIFEKATAEELNNLSCGMFLLANFFISRILLELAQGIVYMYLTGFEQDTSILFALMFVLQALAIIAENTPDREEIGNLMEDGISSYTSAANLLLKTSIGAVMLIPQLAFSFDVEHDEFHSFPFLVCLTIFLWILNNLNDNLQMTQPGSLVAAFSIAVYFVRQLSALAFLLMSLVLVCIKLLFLQFDSDFVWVVSFMILTFFSMGFLCALSSRIVMFMKNIFQRRPIEGERPIENDLVNDSFERDVIQLEL